MTFIEKIDKLIAAATAERQAAEARMKKLMDEKAVVERAISAVIEKQLGIIGELRALEQVKKDASEEAPKEN